MSFHDLRGFPAHLERARQLPRVAAPIDPHLDRAPPHSCMDSGTVASTASASRSSTCKASHERSH